MPGGISITHDFGAKRRRREQEWDQAVKENPDLARDFNEYNQGREEYVRTGQFPTSRRQEVRTNIGLADDVPNPQGGTPISVLPTMEVGMQDTPIQRGSPSFTFNQKTGRYEEADAIPRGSEVRSFNPPGQSYAIGYDDQGRIVTQEPISGDRDISFRIGDLAARGKGGRGGSGQTPQQRAWQTAYNAALRSLMPKYDIMGKPIAPEIDPRLIQAGIDAGQGLGIDTSFLEDYLAEIQPPSTPPPAAPPSPGIFDRAKDFFTSGPKDGSQTPDNSPERAAPGATGKALSRDEAKRILQEAGGDPAKARELARKRGFTF